MTNIPQAPQLIKPIPPQIANERSSFGPLKLREYIQSTDEESGEVHFFVELADGNALPRGLLCSSDGILGGIPDADTQGEYRVLVIAENQSGIPFTTEFNLSIKSSFAMGGDEQTAEWWTDLKARVWEALENNQIIPNLDNLYKRHISATEIYYLLERYATLTLWDAYNLDLPGEKIILNLKDASPHYHIYDRGSCIVGTPKDLFSHARTLEDTLQTAKVMAQEVYNRGWAIQLAGFEKMMRRAWIEIQLLGDKHQKKLEILHYVPTAEDIKIYHVESDMLRFSN